MDAINRWLVDRRLGRAIRALVRAVRGLDRLGDRRAEDALDAVTLVSDLRRSFRRRAP